MMRCILVILILLVGGCAVSTPPWSPDEIETMRAVNVNYVPVPDFWTSG